jgi:hypothetical protein
MGLAPAITSSQEQSWTLSPGFWSGDFRVERPIRGLKLQNRIDFLPNHGDESRN